MNDRDLMEDVLLILKGAAHLHLHGTIVIFNIKCYDYI